jgi:predicted nucleic acid-binding protein
MMRTGGVRLTSKPPCGTAGASGRSALPGLLIAAVAERERVTVLHYEGDDELIAQVTGQSAQLVAARGTVP